MKDEQKKSRRTVSSAATSAASAIHDSPETNRAMFLQGKQLHSSNIPSFHTRQNRQSSLNGSATNQPPQTSNSEITETFNIFDNSDFLIQNSPSHRHSYNPRTLLHSNSQSDSSPTQLDQRYRKNQQQPQQQQLQKQQQLQSESTLTQLATTNLNLSIQSKKPTSPFKAFQSFRNTYKVNIQNTTATQLSQTHTNNNNNTNNSSISNQSLNCTKFLRKPIIVAPIHQTEQYQSKKEGAFSAFSYLPTQQQQQNINLLIKYKKEGKQMQSTYTIDTNTIRPTTAITQFATTATTEPNDIERQSQSQLPSELNSRLNINKKNQILNFSQIFTQSHTFFTNKNTLPQNQSQVDSNSDLATLTATATATATTFNSINKINPTEENNNNNNTTLNNKLTKSTSNEHLLLQEHKSLKRLLTSQSIEQIKEAFNRQQQKDKYKQPMRPASSTARYINPMNNPSIHTKLKKDTQSKNSNNNTDTYNFIKINFTQKQPTKSHDFTSTEKNQQETSTTLITHNQSRKMSQEAQLIISSLPDMKFHSNNKVVACHLQQKTKLIQPKEGFDQNQQPKRNLFAPSNSSKSPHRQQTIGLFQTIQTLYKMNHKPYILKKPKQQQQQHQSQSNQASLLTSKAPKYTVEDEIEPEDNNLASINVIEEQKENMKLLFDHLDRMNINFRERVSLINNKKYLITPEDTSNNKLDRLTFDELEQVKHIFSLPVMDEQSVEQLDMLLTHLQFFTSLPQDTRLSLLPIVKFHRKEKGEIVFRQGDFGDHMFVIIYGSCEVVVKSSTESGMHFERVVTTLFDGQQFGELSMMKTTASKNSKISLETDMREKSVAEIKQKLTHINAIQELERLYQRKGLVRSRSQIEQEYETSRKSQNDQNSKESRTTRAATIQTAEETYLISIDKKDFQSILLNLVQEEIDSKVLLLNTIPLFEMIQPFALIPLANLLKVQKYSTNDVVVEQGKPMKYFYIVAKGRLRVVRIQKTHRQRIIKPNSKSMIFSLNDYQNGMKKQQEQRNNQSQSDNESETEDLPGKSSEQTNNTREIQVASSKFLRRQSLTPAVKVHDFQEINNRQQHNDQQKIRYQQFIDYTYYSNGDYFGGRVLLKKPNPSTNPTGVALKTIIADTNDVEVFVLEREQVVYLPQFLQGCLITGLENSKEFDDDIEVESLSTNINQWEKFKEKTFLEQKQTLSDERHQKNFFSQNR